MSETRARSISIQPRLGRKPSAAKSFMRWSHPPQAQPVRLVTPPPTHTHTHIYKLHPRHFSVRHPRFFRHSLQVRYVPYNLILNLYKQIERHFENHNLNDDTCECLFSKNSPCFAAPSSHCVNTNIAIMEVENLIHIYLLLPETKKPQKQKHCVSAHN